MQSESKKPTIMIATPMYGGMCTGHYLVSMMGTMQRLKDLGINAYFAQITNESLITRARNELVRLFLERGLDYLMFIDADIHFPINGVTALMAADRDIVCGIYPKKEVAWDRVEEAAKAGKTDLKDYSGSFVFNMVTNESGVVETDDEGIIEIRHGGTGFMLIKRGVFERLAPHVPTYRTSSFKDPKTGEYAKPLTHEFFATSIDKTGALLSEDYHFCELWRSEGGKIHAHPFLKLDHVGTYVYTGDLVKSGGNLK
jgi:hypothetical protein